MTSETFREFWEGTEWRLGTHRLLSLTKRRACGFGVENGKRVVAVHKSAVRLPSSRNIPARVSRLGLLP